MSYLSCPRCRLTIRIRAPYLAMRNCPRCLAHAGLPTPMYSSPRRVIPSPGEKPPRIPPSTKDGLGADGSAARRIAESSRRCSKREPPHLRGFS
jgi:hypothetical protein